MPFNMFDVTRYGNAKRGPSTGLKIAVPSKRKGFAREPSSVRSLILLIDSLIQGALMRL